MANFVINAGGGVTGTSLTINGGGTFSSSISSTFGADSRLNGVTNACLNAKYSGRYGAIFNAPVKTGRISLATEPNKNDIVWLGYIPTGQTDSYLYHQILWDTSANKLYADNFVGALTGNASTATTATSANYATTATYLKNLYSSRPTSADVSFSDGKIRYFLATGSMTTGKPPEDSYILHFAWDNGSYYDAQMAFGYNSNHIYHRGQNGTSWGNWQTVAYTTDTVASATALTTSAGTATLPVYFSNGKPVACTDASLFSNLSNRGNNISITVGGYNRTVTPAYAAHAGYSDKITQTIATANADRAVLLGEVHTAATTTNSVYKANNIYYNPSTGKLTTTTFNGNLTGNATSASSSTNATNATNIHTGVTTSTIYFIGVTASTASTAPAYKITNGMFYGNTTGIYYTSDRRRKHDITPIKADDVSNYFNHSYFKHFVWNDNDKPSYGVIAQETKRWCPEAVDYNEENGYFAVNYQIVHSKAIGLLTEEIKELKKEIQELHKLIEK